MTEIEKLEFDLSEILKQKGFLTIKELRLSVEENNKALQGTDSAKINNALQVLPQLVDVLNIQYKIN